MAMIDGAILLEHLEKRISCLAPKSQNTADPLAFQVHASAGLAEVQILKMIIKELTKEA